MTQHRILIDIEFAVDEGEFKVAQLADDATGVSEVTEAGVRDAVTGGLIHANWAEQGLVPLRSIVTTRPLGPAGNYAEVRLPAEPGANVDCDVRPS